MSSQASSAGHGEKEVRQKLVETGDVDVMISIRQLFLHAHRPVRAVALRPQGKPADRRDQVLMLDARSIGQLMKGSRKVHEFYARADAQPHRHRLALSRAVWRDW
jgi:type I restriction enzyme M protein